jgi:FkbM family methyltransferase
MKQDLGWYFPDGEKHLPDWMRTAGQKRDGRLQYQFNKYQAAMKWVKQRRVAVDVGAHIGQWSRNMAADFQAVHAFEPVPTYAECWRKNMEGIPNATLHAYALGGTSGVVSLTCGTPGSHGDTFIAPRETANAAHDVPMQKLDWFGLENIDFMKIDCEGYEANVLRGAERTIKICRPCIIVEQKPGMAQKYGLAETHAVAILKSWGAKQRQEISGDFILSW